MLAASSEKSPDTSDAGTERKALLSGELQLADCGAKISQADGNGEKLNMQAHQFVTALSYGDAIGDYTLEIQRLLRKNGYDSEIYSEIVHPRMAKHVRPMFDYEFHQNDDVLMIVHFSIGSELGLFTPYCRGKKMLIYHNITPFQ